MDLETKEIALKAVWPIRWNERNPSEIEWVFKRLPVKDSRLWECNLNPLDAQMMLKSKPIATTSHILIAWAKVHFQKEITKLNEILNSLIWGNSLIRPRNKPILNKKIQNSNIERLLDIVNMNRKAFFSYGELINQYDKVTTMLEYNLIIAAIPRSWKRLIRTEDLKKEIDVELAIEKWRINSVNKKKSCTKLMYWQLIEQKYPVEETLVTIWNNELNSQMSIQDIWDLFPYFLKQVKPTKLRQLQYRLLTRSLVTNYKCNKWDHNVSKTCAFCNEHTETIHHLFVDCPKVRQLWEKLG